MTGTTQTREMTARERARLEEMLARASAATGPKGLTGTLFFEALACGLGAALSWALLLSYLGVNHRGSDSTGLVLMAGGGIALGVLAFVLVFRKNMGLLSAIGSEAGAHQERIRADLDAGMVEATGGRITDIKRFRDRQRTFEVYCLRLEDGRVLQKPAPMAATDQPPDWLGAELTVLTYPNSGIGDVQCDGPPPDLPAFIEMRADAWTTLFVHRWSNLRWDLYEQDYGA